MSLKRSLTRGSCCLRPKQECPGHPPGTSQVLFLVALGNLLLDIGRDALVGLVQRRLAGDRLTEPADHRIEDHAVVRTLQLVGDRGELRHAFAEDLEGRLALGRGVLVLEPLLGEAKMARYEQRPFVELLGNLIAGKILDDARLPWDAAST